LFRPGALRMQYVPIPAKAHLQYWMLDFAENQNPMIVYALQVVLQDQVFPSSLLATTCMLACQQSRVLRHPSGSS
jgi:hypothetical protein